MSLVEIETIERASKLRNEWRMLLIEEENIKLRKLEIRRELKEIDSSVDTYLVSDSRAPKMEKQFREGLTLREIAKEWKLSHEHVRNILKSNGITDESIRQELVDRIKRLADKRMTREEIIKEVDITPGSLRYLTNKYGIKIISNYRKEIENRDDRVVELYECGLTQVEIAKEMNLKQINVSRILIKRGKTRERTDENKVMEMKKSGWGTQDIANHFGVTVGNIYRIYSKFKEDTN